MLCMVCGTAIPYDQDDEQRLCSVHKQEIELDYANFKSRHPELYEEIECH